MSSPVHCISTYEQQKLVANPSCQVGEDVLRDAVAAIREARSDVPGRVATCGDCRAVA